MVFYQLKKYTKYIKGVVGADIKLSLRQKIQVLFCDGISIALGDVFQEDE